MVGDPALTPNHRVPAPPEAPLSTATIQSHSLTPILTLSSHSQILHTLFHLRTLNSHSHMLTLTLAVTHMLTPTQFTPTLPLTLNSHMLNSHILTLTHAQLTCSLYTHTHT